MLAAELIKLYQIENQAMVAKDTVTLERLLAPEMHLIHMTGYASPKRNG
ncbi:nuclear transport factor 2 family protein [Ligilactobacillus murinus]|nr:nuclear transport factor 2 family protein [Ligilactobacillus murinus]WOY89883.1 nuclear transport factor 2 family protein [Ligilactobacillus murinus]